MKLRRFWFEFNMTLDDNPPVGTLMGCGVTAYDYEDAIKILKEKVFEGENLPQFKSEIEDVDVSTLDQNHVVPNMGIVTNRGVWFPLGYE